MTDAMLLVNRHTYLTLLVLSIRTAYEGGATLLSTETRVLAARPPSFSRYHSLRAQIANDNSHNNNSTQVCQPMLGTY